MSNTIFTIGCFRSGTTALERILDTADNTQAHVELAPKLLVESRHLYEGKLINPDEALWSARSAQIEESHSAGLKFIDKNPAYLPFIPSIFRLWDSQVLFVYRDGREVVRSLIDWHDMKAHCIYARQEDGSAGKELSPQQDQWGYSMLRPREEDACYSRWKQMTRFEHCAWFWSRYNELALNALSRIDARKWLFVNMNELDVGRVKDLFTTLGLSGFNKDRVESMLTARINSVQERVGEPDHFPAWPSWDEEKVDQFNTYANDIMQRLGYYPQDHK